MTSPEKQESETVRIDAEKPMSMWEAIKARGDAVQKRREAGVVFGERYVQQIADDRRWLLQRVTEMEKALTNLYHDGVTGKVNLVGLALAKEALAALTEPAEES